MSKSLLAWHFLPNNGLTANDENIKVEPNQTLVVDKPSKLKLCSYGYHGSVRAIDALKYAPGNIICRVKLHGTVIEDDDKAVATRRTCIWLADATRTLQEFAIWCAEDAIAQIQANGIEVDPRTTNAIVVAKMYLNGNTTLSDINAAANAANAAANAANAAANAAYAVYAAANAADAANAANAANAADAAANAANAAANAADAVRAAANAAANAANAVRAAVYAAANAAYAAANAAANTADAAANAADAVRAAANAAANAADAAARKKQNAKLREMLSSLE